MSIINTTYIDNINAQLEDCITYLDNTFGNLSAFTNKSQEELQEYVDNQATIVSEQLNKELNDVRGKIVSVFSSQYQIALEKIKPIEPLINMEISLDTIVEVVKSIIQIITAPYQPIIEFTTEIIPKVLELSNNIQKVATYQPKIDIPGITPPQLTIEVEPITAKDITG